MSQPAWQLATLDTYFDIQCRKNDLKKHRRRVCHVISFALAPDHILNFDFFVCRKICQYLNVQEKNGGGDRKIVKVSKN